MIAWVGETTKDMGPEEFFGTINRFYESIREAEKANIKAIQDAEKAKRREEQKAKRDAEISAKKGPGGAEGHDSVVEELFGALKGGNVFKNRRVQERQQKDAPAEQPGKFQMPTLRSANKQ